VQVRHLGTLRGAGGSDLSNGIQRPNLSSHTLLYIRPVAARRSEI
jgi:hypothetical protein